MALFVLKEGFQVESTPTGGRVVHVRTGDALDLSAPEVALLARATAGGVDSQDAELRPLLKKLARMGLLVPTAGRVSDMEASLQAPPAAAAPPAAPLTPDATVPFFRRDLQLSRVPDSSTYQVADPATNRSFTLYDFELSLARMLDGKRHAAEVLEAGERLGIPVDLDSLGKFIRQLELYGFLAAPDATPQPSRQQPREKWDDNLRQLFQSGLKLSRQGRYIESAQYFEAMLAQDPQNAEALERLAQVRQRLGLPAPAEGDSFLAPPAEGGEMDWGAGLPTELDAEIPSLLFSVHESEPQVAEAGPAALAALEAAAAAEAAAVANAAAPSPLEAGVMAAVDEAPSWSDAVPAQAEPQEIPIEVGAEDAGEVEIAVEASESPAAFDWSDLNTDAPAPAASAVAVPEPEPEPEPEPVPAPETSGFGAALFDAEPAPAAPAAAEPAPKPAASGLEASFFDSEPSAEGEAAAEEKPADGPAPEVMPVAASEKVREQRVLPMAMPERMHVGTSSPSKLPMLLAGLAVTAAAFVGGWFLGSRGGEKGASLTAKPVVAVTSAKTEVPKPTDPKPEPVKPAEAKPEPSKPAEPAVASPADPGQAAAVPAKFEGKIPPADPIDSKIPEDEGEAVEPAAPAPVAAPAEPAAQPAAEPAAASEGAISVEISKRGRVTMCTLAAPAEGQVAWTAKEQQRIKKGQPLGNLGAAPLSAPCAGLLIPLVGDKGAAAAGETLADVVYHQGYLKTLVPGAKKPEASWGCEVVDEASGQKTGCTINQASAKAGGFFITAIFEPMWVDTAEQPKLLLMPK